MGETVSFWQNWFVWRDAMIVSLVCGAALAYLGVWAMLRKMVYVPLALSQVSSVGVVLAFFLADLFGVKGALRVFLDPTGVSFLFAVMAALFFARAGRGSLEATAVAYLLAAAAAILLGGFVRADVHDVSDVLFGNAVLVETWQIAVTAGAALIAAVIHALGYRRFLFASYDPDSAGAAGIKVFRQDVLLFVSMAIMISAATRAIGGLPAFAFTVLPALAALRIGRTMGRTFVLALVAGALSAGLGYYVSFALDLPTGACMTAVAAIFYIASNLVAQR